jgi:hypothetical protein
MKTNHIKAALVIALMMSCSTAFAQLYKTDFTTKIVLTNTGFPANPLNVVTLTAPAAMTGPLTLVLPPNAGTSGYMLTTNGAGITSWTDPTVGITLTGDVIGAVGANTINASAPAGNHAVTAINLANASTLNADVLKHDATLTVAGNQLGIDLTHANNWTGQQTITLPSGFKYVDGNQGAGKVGWVLTEDINGVGAWSNPGSIVTLTGDVNGLANANTVNSVQLNAGPSIALAINNNAAPSINGNQVNHDATLKTAAGTPFALGIDLAHDNLWASTQTFGGVGKGLIVGNNGVTTDATLTVNGANGFKYVDGNQTAGWVLTESAAGVAKWADPSLAITLAGDVTGPAGTNTVAKINGVPLGSTTATAGNLLIGSGSQWVSTGLTGDVSLTAAGLAHVNSVQTAAGPSIATAINGNTAPSLNGQQVSHDATLAITGNNIGINLANSNSWNSLQTYTGAGNGVTIATTADFTLSGHGATLNYVLTSDANGKASWTNPLTSIVLGGDVTGAAGNNTIAATLQSGNDIVAALNFPATPSTLNAEVLKHDATLQVNGTHQLGINTGNPNTWTGTQTFGATAQTSATIAFAADLAIGTSNTLYKVTGTGTATGMQNGVDGRNVTLTKTDAGYITLTSNAGGADQFIIPGGDPVIMGQNATVILQYDITVTGWRVIGGF